MFLSYTKTTPDIIMLIIFGAAGKKNIKHVWCKSIIWGDSFQVLTEYKFETGPFKRSVTDW